MARGRTACSLINLTCYDKDRNESGAVTLTLRVTFARVPGRQGQEPLGGSQRIGRGLPRGPTGSTEGHLVATKLQIRHLRIRTVGGWQDPYDLDHPVVAVIGPVDTGKSSMLDCITFGLGGEVEDFRGAVDKHLREVEVGIQVRTGAFTLRRTRRTQSRVDVFDATGTIERTLYIRGRGDQPSISDWLLEQMGLDDLLASVRLPDGRNLDFSSGLLPYLYRAQDDIDRHIIRPARDDVSRLAVLRLLLNLTSPEAERLLGEIRDADNEIVRLARQSRMIREFLAGSPAGGQEALNHEIAELRQDRMGADSDLSRLRGGGRTK